MGHAAQSELALFSEAHPEAVRWTELVEQISVAARVLCRELAQYAAKVNLSEAQFSILWACLKSMPDGIAQNELADALAISPAHVSGITERLRQAGLLEPQRSSTDRRRQLWRVSAKGHEKLRQFLSELAGTDVAESCANQQKLLSELLEAARVRSGTHQPENVARLSMHARSPIITRGDAA